MSRIILAVLMLSLVAFSVVGCGGSRTTPVSTVSTQTPGTPASNAQFTIYQMVVSSTASFPTCTVIRVAIDVTGDNLELLAVGSRGYLTSDLHCLVGQRAEVKIDNVMGLGSVALPAPGTKFEITTSVLLTRGAHVLELVVETTNVGVTDTIQFPLSEVRCDKAEFISPGWVNDFGKTSIQGG